MAIDADQAKTELAERLAAQQAETIAQPKNPLKTLIKAASSGGGGTVR
jgi:hypothetical protein